MTILAHYTPKNITVEITDAWTTSDGRERASITTTDGSAPFASWTHGGWAYTETAHVSQDHLADIVITADLGTPCPHRDAVLEVTGGMRFAAGGLDDTQDLQLRCPACGALVADCVEDPALAVEVEF